VPGLCGEPEEVPKAEVLRDARAGFPAFRAARRGRYGIGVALQNQGRAADARAVYEPLAKAAEGETAAKTRFMLGEIAFGERKFEDAIEHYLAVTRATRTSTGGRWRSFEIGPLFPLAGETAEGH